jgi:hypothetical protein
LAILLGIVWFLTDARVALGHGIGGRLDLPVPVTYFAAGAAVVLILSFVALSALWDQPRLEGGPRGQDLGIRARTGWLGVVGLAGLLLVVGQIVPETAGLEVGPLSIAPVLVWVLFWLVVPFLSALVGDWYTDLNPWRAIATATDIGGAERGGLLSRAGVWPASVLLIAFVWLELIHPDPADPVVLGGAALVYTAFLLVAMGYAGRETGLVVFDVFTTYNRLISSISPIGRSRDGKLIWRGWLRSLAVIPSWPGLWFFVVAAIGTVTFDGLSGTDWYPTVFGRFGESMPGATILLLAAVGLIAAGYRVACFAAARASGKEEVAAARVAARFAHTLVPIALAYALAHYLTLILFEGQQIIAAVSDPFGLGWDLFGTAGRRIDFFVTAAEPIWYAQVAIIVGGHLLGVILAHDRALTDFGRGAVRSQYAMLLLMVALTTLGLLILAG